MYLILKDSKNHEKAKSPKMTKKSEKGLKEKKKPTNTVIYFFNC
jgi:hypothetical protein